MSNSSSWSIKVKGENPEYSAGKGVVVVTGVGSRIFVHVRRDDKSCDGITVE